MNFIQALFSLMAASVIMFSTVINLFESKLPNFFSQIFRYGKFAAERKSCLAIEVPKSWFKHFYYAAIFEYMYAFGLVIAVYFFGLPVPEIIKQILDLVCGVNRVSFIPKHKVFISMYLMTMQVYRRYYDTQYISVYGEKSKMNLSHYLIGMIYYPGAAMAILCEAPLFANAPDSINNADIDLLSTSFSDILAVLIFLIAWKHQQICTQILADLRKNEKGDIVTHEYKLPQGDWFEYLSCPHQTAEIIMYSCLMWILWYNITWSFIFIWVVANQVETIMLSHWWYQEKFEDFPKKRKALIPFIY
ncbi:polyprenol reductase [Anthonomus grandis grandis]|uniref:polyprenol reductase n=1 Tax=Anthonomus grandis grandis TaxID=2921223 RepID=UPI0021655C84|nr:polyprenol reductase [Anthonomus grandis grandis]